VRSGLLIVGSLLAVIGAVTLIGVVVLPLAAPTTSVTRSTETFVVPGNGTAGSGIHLPSSGAQSLVISWAADVPIGMELYAAVPCPHGPSGLCPTGSPIESWVASEGGTWSSTSSIASGYLLHATTPAQSPAIIDWTLVETSQSTLPELPLWTYIAFLSAGAGLVILGSLAVFLGLFLKSGVYSGRPPVVPLGPEILDEWAWANDPDAPDDPPGPP